MESGYEDTEAVTVEESAQKLGNVTGNYKPEGADQAARSKDGYATGKADASSNGLSSNLGDDRLPRKTNDKIIRTGNIGLQLEDYDKDKHQFYDAFRKYDAYISNENERKETNRISNDIEIRVPNEAFDKLVAEIAGGKGIRNIDYKRISAVDVGEEYYDLQTRIKTKKEVEQRYLEILRSAKKVEDILAVEGQIRVIREEIEAKEGRLRFLADRISYSTVHLYIYQELEYDAPMVDKPTFWGKMGNAMKGGWNAILSFLLLLGYIWPIVVLVVVIIFMYKRKLFIFKKKDNGLKLD